MNNITYLDTSGLNFLADYIGDSDAFRLWKDRLKIDFCISGVVLWEILLNSNKERREYLIYWSQFNCSEYLLKSPTELFINYLEQNCPVKDRKSFWYNRETKLNIGNTWKNTHGDIKKTILVDIDALKKHAAPIRGLSKKLKKIIDDMCNKEHPRYRKDPFNEAMYKVLGNLKRKDSISHDDELIIKLALVFIFFFVCIGMELDCTPIRDYWAEKDIEDPFERLDWIIENHPEMVIRGPILEMAKMAESQFISSNSSSRGLLHDCLHSVYCYYADNIISGDAHFKILKENVNHVAFQGIIMADNFKEMWEETVNVLRRRPKMGYE